MAIVNPLLNVKDSRWLQLEVCREFQRNKCTRPDSECKFAHPAANVEVQNGRVIACYDSIKGRCNREKPPCKYFHPPKHLKDQLVINGKNHLALKNALLQQVPFQTVLAGQLPMVGSVANLLNTYPRNLSPSTMVNSQPYSVAAFASALNGQSQSMIANSSAAKAPNPYLTNLPALAAASSAAAAAAYGAYSAPSPATMLMTAEQLSSSYGLTSTSSTASSAVSSPGASNKTRVETTVSSATGAIEPHVVAEASSLSVAAAAAAAAAAAGRKRTREQTSDELLMQISGAYPVTKRTALDKNGTPLYPGAAAAAAATTYPQPLTVHQPFVPLSFYFPLVGQSNTIPRY